VPEIVAVPFAAGAKATPFGSAPRIAIVPAGDPDVLTVTLNAVPVRATKRVGVVKAGALGAGCTMTACCAGGAGTKWLFPFWMASTRHFPGVWKVTTA
jgi:hypothetical protein